MKSLTWHHNGLPQTHVLFLHMFALIGLCIRIFAEYCIIMCVVIGRTFVALRKYGGVAIRPTNHQLDEFT